MKPSSVHVAREDLVERLPKILAWLRSHGIPEQDARDVAHDAVVAVCEAAERSGPERAELSSRVARHAARRFWRRGRLEDAVQDIDALSTEARDPERELREKEIRSLLARLLNDLRPERRAVIEQACLEGRPLTEIATDQGISYDTAASRWKHGLEDLEASARRHRARQRRGNDPLPVVPFWPGGRRSQASRPAALMMGAVGGALVVAVFLLGRPGTVETTAAAPTSAPVASKEPTILDPAPAVDRPSRGGPGAPVAAPKPERKGHSPQEAETTLLRDAKRALATGRVDEAARLVNEHARRYPKSQHSPDRAEVIRRLGEHQHTR